MRYALGILGIGALVVLAGVVGGVAGSPSGGIATLVGGQCDDTLCKNKLFSVDECAHPSLPRNAPCLTTRCLQTIVYYPQCPFLCGGAPCPIKSSGQPWGVQFVYENLSGFGDCPGNPAWTVISSSNACGGIDTEGKCFMSNCIGDYITTYYSYTRQVCI